MKLALPLQVHAKARRTGILIVRPRCFEGATSKRTDRKKLRRVRQGIAAVMHNDLSGSVAIELREARLGTSGYLFMDRKTRSIKGPTWGRLSKAYVSLALTAELADRSRKTTVDRYGAYEVRVVELSPGSQTEAPLFWLELYCHVTERSLDSCCCNDLDDAERAAEFLITCAKQLHDKSE